MGSEEQDKDVPRLADLFPGAKPESLRPTLEVFTFKDFALTIVIDGHFDAEAIANTRKALADIGIDGGYITIEAYELPPRSESDD